MQKAPQQTEHLPSAARFAVPLGASLAALLALISLAYHWPALALDGSSLSAFMAPASAVGILLAALALLMVCTAKKPVLKPLGCFAAAATLLLGLLTIGQYLANWQPVFERGTLTAAEQWWSQRPTPATGLGLVFAGSATLALGAKPHALRRCSGPLAAATLAVALSVLVSRVYGHTLNYGLSAWGGTAISTGLALMLLGLAILIVNPMPGFVALLMSRSSAGHLVRQLTPAAVLTPLLLGWLVLWAQQSGLVSAAFGTAVLVVVSLTLLVGLIVRQAKVLHATDQERERLHAGELNARQQKAEVLESITDAFFAVDHAWRFTYLNHEAERLLDRPRDSLIGRAIWSEFPGVVGLALKHHSVLGTRGNQPIEFEEYYPLRGIWFDVRVYPSAEGFSVYFRDVTERKLAQERIRESEERYRLLIDMIPQHIWTTEPDDSHTYYSRRWQEYTGMTPEQAEDDHWLELVHPDDRAAVAARWKQALATGEAYSAEYRVRRADGIYCWFLGQARPLHNANGETVRWFGALTDISERKHFEQERERLLELERKARAEADRRHAELQRVTESRARLIFGFSHDVRNPLSVADSHAWLLESGRIGPLEPKQEASVTGIRRAIQTSVRLIEDLLELARAESGELEIRRTDTELATATCELLEDFEAHATAARLELKVDVPPGLHTNTDPTRLRQVLANLLSNAAKYASGSRVTIEAKRVIDGGPQPGCWLAISVRDTGPGIPEGKQELVFLDYTRLDPDAQHGAGIGLAISRRIARLLGGDLTVTSTPGQGACFTLWLPDTAEHMPTAMK